MQDENTQQTQAEVHSDATRMLHGATYQLDVFRIANGQPFVDEGEHAILRFVGIFRTQDERTHYGAQREGHYRRQQHGYHDSHRKLSVKLTRNARQEAHWHKHGRQHERRGDDGAYQSVHSLLRSLVRTEVFFFHNTLYILHHHDSVVHHDTDSQHKTKQGQHIERESENKHETKGTNK